MNNVTKPTGPDIPDDYKAPVRLLPQGGSGISFQPPGPNGVALRDHYASIALESLMRNYRYTECSTAVASRFALDAYDIADAMILQRQVPTQRQGGTGSMSR